MNATPPAENALPPALAARPWDEKRKLPIPVMNMPPGSVDRAEADFTAIHAVTVLDCGQKRLCGICGEPLGYWIAFLGGPKSAESRAYVDPPFHVDCAVASLGLCPHIAIPHHKRAPEHRLAADASAPDGFDEARAEEWVLGITRDYKIENHGGHPVFRPAPFKQVRRFGYVDGVLAEVAR